MQASFNTLDDNGRNTIAEFVNGRVDAGNDVCSTLFGDTSDDFRLAVEPLKKDEQVKFLEALVEVEILDPQSIGL